MKEILDPETLEDWQDLADLAETYLALESARQSGLINGGPDVNVDRCESLLAGACSLGIKPRPDAIERCGPGVFAEYIMATGANP